MIIEPSDLNSLLSSGARMTIRFTDTQKKMAAAVDARTCGSCCLKLKELVNSYEEELGLKGKEFDGTKSTYPIARLF